MTAYETCMLVIAILGLLTPVYLFVLSIIFNLIEKSEKK